MPGTDGGTGGFDPRFDPQFQPGYHPGGSVASGRPPLRPAPGVEVRPLRDDVFAAVVPSAAPATPVSGRPEGVGYGDRPVDDARYDGAGYDGESDDEYESAVGTSARSNPFLLALWAIGAAFIVGGLMTFAFLRSLNETLASGAATPSDYSLAQSITPLPSQLVLFGAAIVVVLLFHQAMRRDRDLRERASSESALPERRPASGAQNDTRPGRGRPQV